MFLIMRWMICPCEGCYERLPEWTRPLQEQLNIAHPAWNDYVPWPIIRLRLITVTPVQFENYFVPFTEKLWVNWPSASDQVLLAAPRPDDAGAVKINPAFEIHLRELQHWSVASTFKASFPELVDDTVRIKD